MARKPGALKAKAQGTAKPPLDKETCANAKGLSLILDCERAGLREPPPQDEETVEQKPKEDCSKYKVGSREWIACRRKEKEK